MILIFIRRREAIFIEIITKPYNNAISYNGKYYYISGSTNQELIGNEVSSSS
ncbi:MAG TPA: hypothetical protein VLZ72_10335 [Flavobacterium sp.]|nr:hypothetical protein [Flavobacterium sp.]